MGFTEKQKKMAVKNDPGKRSREELFKGRHSGPRISWVFGKRQKIGEAEQ